LKIRYITVLFLILPLAFAGNLAPIEIGHQFSLHSKVLNEDRTIMVGLPQGYDGGADTFPVLYLTDARAQFQHTVATIGFLARNNRMPATIVVAVVNTDRTRDLTPPTTTPNPQMATAGGADNFLDFFESELIPYVEKNYRTQPFRIFAGHSFGGLFSVHAFLSKNDLFNAYIAVSPSLWWDNEANVGKMERFLVDKAQLNKTLFLSLGSEGDQMEKPFAAMKSVLAAHNIDGFSWDTLSLPDEDHGSVVLRSHYFGLKKIFDGWQIPQEVANGGLTGLESHYQQLSKRMGYTIAPPETTINNMGYGALFRGDFTQALAIFEHNVKTYPNSANVYDSYAEALEKSGKLEPAQKNYASAYERGLKANDPNTAVYKANLDRVAEMLKKAKAKTGT